MGGLLRNFSSIVRFFISSSTATPFLASSEISFSLAPEQQIVG